MSNPKGELSVVDWLLCIFCSFIGCIIGIVALIQGDTKRGGIMILVSLFSGVIIGAIKFALNSAVQGIPQ